MSSGFDFNFSLFTHTFLIFYGTFICQKNKFSCSYLGEWCLSTLSQPQQLVIIRRDDINAFGAN